MPSKNKTELKQQRQQRQEQRGLKNDLYSTYESHKNLDSSSLCITVRDILNRICQTASKFEKEV